MNAFTDTFEKMSSFGAEGFGPVREVAGVAVDSIEQLARTNYAVAGDVLEFAVEAARLPLSVSAPQELFDRQMAATKAFSEVIAQRVNEYAELGKNVQTQFAQYADVEPAPVKKTGRKKRSTKAA